jgi:hypothetical protein
MSVATEKGFFAVERLTPGRSASRPIASNDGVSRWIGAKAGLLQSFSQIQRIAGISRDTHLELGGGLVRWTSPAS